MPCLDCPDWDKKTNFCCFTKCTTPPDYDCHAPEFEDGPVFEGWDERSKATDCVIEDLSS